MILSDSRVCTAMLMPLALLISACAGQSTSRPAGPSLTHVETITGNNAEFEITVPGTVDHRSMGGWKPDATAKYNPTLSLAIENTGDRPIVNPRVFVDGGPDWFDVQHMVGEFTRSGMSDQEKSFALWQWCRHNITGGPTFEGMLWGEGRSMTKFMNACGTGACGTYHIVMPVIGMEAGLRTFSGCFADCSHAVQHEWYDGQGRYFDAHIEHGGGQPQGWFALKLNNNEIAGVEDIMDDRYLIDRAGSGAGRYDYVAYFGPGCHFGEEKRERFDSHRMALTLRPGESIRWSWNLDQPAWQPDPKDITSAGAHCSGRIIYAPGVADSTPGQYALTVNNLRAVTHAEGDALQVDDPSKPGEIIYKLRCPYPMTTMHIGCRQFEGGEEGTVDFNFSFDGASFAGKSSHTDTDGLGRLYSLEVSDGPNLRQPQFTNTVWFRMIVKGEKTIVSPPIMQATFQTYRPSLPSLHCGQNKISFDGRFASPPDPGRTGLANGSFEDAPQQGETPRGWTKFGTTDGVQIGKWYAETEPYQGEAYLVAAAHYGKKDGGVYQQVMWGGGSRVSANVHIITPGDSTLTAGCRIGLDPTGGTDPNSATIVWSPYARNSSWKFIETGPVEIPDTGPVEIPGAGVRMLTVFLNHKHALDGNQFNATAFDLCVLQDLTGEGRFAQDSAKPLRDEVRVSYSWREMPHKPVPQAPAKPIHPPDGGKFGFNETLKWSPAQIGGATQIAGPAMKIDNYEIYISPRADLAWPVMPNMHHITGSREPEFRLIAPDVLRNGVMYYWRVRGHAKDGIWGEWSPMWSFVAVGPNPPTGLSANYDPATGEASVSWTPPVGVVPVDHYEVYASSEHGFSPRRTDEKAYMVGKELTLPATLLAEIKDPRFDVTNRVEPFYRVAAVDKDGNRSVVTPVASLPTPALLPVSLRIGQIGKPFVARIPARLRTGRYARSLKKGLIVDGADDPKFTIQNAGGATWLTIDAKKGVLGGTPTAAGQFTITLTLEDGRGGKATRSYPLEVR